MFFEQDEERASYKAMVRQNRRGVSLSDEKIYEYERDGAYNPKYFEQLQKKNTQNTAFDQHGNKRNSRSSFMQDKKTYLEAIKEDEEGSSIRDEKDEFERKKRKINIFAKMYLILKKSLTEQILFITN